MQVILTTEEFNKLGAMGDTIKVKDGYARNYLIPKNLAVVANQQNKKQLEYQKKIIADKKEKLLKKVNSLAHKIRKLDLEVKKQVGNEERIFGSVSKTEIAELLKGKGFEVPKKDISFPEEMKKTGTYVVTIKLHKEVSADIKVKVTAINSVTPE